MSTPETKKLDAPALYPSDPTPAATRASKSQNVTINLINRLVERGVLTKEDSAELIKQAEDDAIDARAEVEKNAISAAQAVVAQAAPKPASSDDVRVTYVPEVVKAQMRDEIKQEVLTQARAEKWAAPRTFPDWALRFRFIGDVRVRYEGDFYPSGNDNTGAFPNFNAINTGAPFDISPTNLNQPTSFNVDQTRNRFRLRARLGAEVDLVITSPPAFGSAREKTIRPSQKIKVSVQPIRGRAAILANTPSGWTGPSSNTSGAAKRRRTWRSRWGVSRTRFFIRA